MRHTGKPSTPRPLLLWIDLPYVVVPHDGRSDLGQLKSSRVLAGARSIASAPLCRESVHHRNCREAPPPRGRDFCRLTGMKHLSFSAASGRSHRSGLNSRASGPHISLELWITDGLIVRVTPWGKYVPPIVTPPFGATRGRPARVLFSHISCICGLAGEFPPSTYLIWARGPACPP